jgi:hypothetical protein
MPGIVNGTPATGQEFVEATLLRTSAVFPLTITPVTKRLRVDIDAAVPISVQGQPYFCDIILEDNAVLEGVTVENSYSFCDTAFSYEKLRVSAGITDIAVGGGGSGMVHIHYRTSPTTPWRFVDILFINSGGQIDREYVITRGNYKIGFEALEDSAWVDLMVMLLPKT